MADYDRHDWLSLRCETALDPTRPIIDAHHHLWDRDGSRYLASELAGDTRASHNITHTVFVECSSSYDPSAGSALAPVGETRFVAEQAAESDKLAAPPISAIVGHADLSLGDRVAEVLDAHEQAGGGLFRGVRHGTNWSRHPDVKNGHHQPGPELMSQSSFRNGLQTLADRGFTFDAWLYFDQLGELVDLARAVPHAAIVLDHLGGPLGIGGYAHERDEVLATWRSGIAAAATCDNVVLKVGGLGMEHYFGTSWAERAMPPSSEEVALQWHDMVGFAIDAFGPSRCMFESNFPVDRQTLPYTVLWNAFEILASPYSAAEQHSLFVETAASTYGIG